MRRPGIIDARPGDILQRVLDRHVPRKSWHPWIWFALLWMTGLLSVTLLAYALRAVLSLAY